MSADKSVFKTTAVLLCGDCKVEIKGLVDAKPNTEVSCPLCGNSESLENAFRIAHQAFADDLDRSVQKKLVNSVRGSKTLKFKAKPIHKRSYKFILGDKRAPIGS